MAKLSAKYEAMVVFSIKNGEDNVKALVEKFKSLIESWHMRSMMKQRAIMFSIHLNPSRISLLSLRE